MKGYVTLKTTDIAGAWGGELRYSPGQAIPQDRSLADLLSSGWRVITASIQPGACGHELPTFIFILERELP